MRNTRAGNRPVRVALHVALHVAILTIAIVAMAIVGGTDVSAHRQDEYLQAARLGIDPGGVSIELDLTPGSALADAIIADLDRNRDGVLSAGEQRAYADLVLSTLDLDVDGTPVRARLDTFSFPDIDAVRRGDGMIRLRSTAPLPPQSVGSHRLLFRNRHDPQRSVYLANALVPASDRVAITAQRRDGDQRELIIEYDMRAAPTTIAMWLLLPGSIAATGVLLRMRRVDR